VRTSPHLSALAQDCQVEPSLNEEVDLATLAPISPFTPTYTVYVAIDRNRGDDNTGQPAKNPDQALSMPFATASGIHRCLKNLANRGIHDVQILITQEKT
jgi:hypothetical protein